MRDSIRLRTRARLAYTACRRSRCSRGCFRELLAVAVLIAALSSACENPLAPELCGAVADQVVPVGGAVSVRVCFNDENGDGVSLASRTSDGTVATVTVRGRVVTVTGVRGGTATVTVTARDPGGLSATVSFGVIVPGIVRLTDRHGLMPAWSPDGTRIAFLGRVPETGDTGDGSIFVMNADGSGVKRLTKSISAVAPPAWSPDGTRIVFTTRDFEIYVVNADGSGEANLTNNADWDVYPAWSPDGTRIAFVSDRDDDIEIYVMNADGSGATTLTHIPARDDWPAWSPDGSRITFTSRRGDDIDIYVMNADGSGVTRLTEHSAFDGLPAWSPDGTRIAFTSDRDGNDEIYVLYVPAR